jgi:hypothetical protein
MRARKLEYFKNTCHVAIFVTSGHALLALVFQDASRPEVKPPYTIHVTRALKNEVAYF